MRKRFRACSFDQPYLLPSSLQDCYRKIISRPVAAAVEELDLSELYAAYQRRDGRGKAAYHLLTTTRLLLYGYAVGKRSSLQLDRTTYDYGAAPAIWRPMRIRITTLLPRFGENI